MHWYCDMLSELSLSHTSAFSLKKVHPSQPRFHQPETTFTDHCCQQEFSGERTRAVGGLQKPAEACRPPRSWTGQFHHCPFQSWTTNSRSRLTKPDSDTKRISSNQFSCLTCGSAALHSLLRVSVVNRSTEFCNHADSSLRCLEW